MNYKISTEINRERWSDFVANHPNGNIFQTPEMYEVYQNTKKYEPVFLAVVNNVDEISGTLLAVIQKEYSGFLGNFTARSIIWGGPLVVNNNNKMLEFILKEYDKLIRNKAIYSQFRNFWEQKTEKDVFKRYDFKYEKHLNIIF